MVREVEKRIGKVGKEVLGVVEVDGDKDSLVVVGRRGEVGETTTRVDGEGPPGDGTKKSKKDGCSEVITPCGRVGVVRRGNVG